MELELLRTLVTLTEAKADVASPKEVKIAKEPEIKPEEGTLDDGKGDRPAVMTPDKTKFFFRPKFDIYGMLVQTDNIEARREAKRVYSILGREHERHAVYGVTSGSEHEFKRIAKMLGISTDGEVTLDRVKRAGFSLAGRIGAKRLMKRGDFLVSLAGPSDDATTTTFYTSKPVEKADKA